MEILNLRSQSSILKLMGTIVSISGAFIVIFYQGLPISSIFPSPTKPSLHSLVELQTQPNWILGGTFLSMCFLLVSFAYVNKKMIQVCGNQPMVSSTFRFSLGLCQLVR